MSEGSVDRLNTAAKSFVHVELADLPKELLMERIDRKFAIHIDQAPQVIAKLSSDYQVISVDGRVISKYNSLYFDTSKYDFYSAHQRGFKNRMKVRYRSYPETSTTFLEVKSKNNKSFTTKERVLTPSMAWPFTVQLNEFIKRQLPDIEPLDLRPTVRIDYERIGFISEDRTERFSLDFNIRFSHDGKEDGFENLAILEVKQPNVAQSPVVMAMRHRSIEEQSLSKYCMALSAINPKLRSNNFKPIFRKIEKITHV
jgi:SPX domain protein involved in polyphosphate accumulation